MPLVPHSSRPSGGGSQSITLIWPSGINGSDSPTTIIGSGLSFPGPDGFDPSFANWVGTDPDGNVWAGSGMVFEGTVYSGYLTVTNSNGAATGLYGLQGGYVETLSSGSDFKALSLAATTYSVTAFGANEFFSQPAVTGALSEVTDAAAKDVLTSIIAVLVQAGFATDGTT